ncbi:hypothetical protein [endosymbiont of Lamellibrachia barhami]|uniref:hypothetical protein n=1 Tax=endosymbiont of Lamellibrachia barhami TaxID=205975 RepID=UPI0015A9922E|nr:hypothetical protein [endosymbiont of Lamellibrachia barhami]
MLTVDPLRIIDEQNHGYPFHVAVIRIHQHREVLDDFVYKLFFLLPLTLDVALFLLFPDAYRLVDCARNAFADFIIILGGFNQRQLTDCHQRKIQHLLAYCVTYFPSLARHFHRKQMAG